MVQFNWKGTWLPNLPYNENVVVEYDNVNYISNQFVPPTDISPYVDTLHWDEMLVLFNTPTPTSSQVATPTVTPSITLTPTPTSTETPTLTPTVTQTPSETLLPTNTPTSTGTPTPTPTLTPTSVTGYPYTLVIYPYNEPSSGNTIFPRLSIPGTLSGITNPNTFNLDGVYWNSIDNTGVDRANYFSAISSNNVSVTYIQQEQIVIYTGVSNSFSIEPGPSGSTQVFHNPGINSNISLVQSASTDFIVGQTVYIGYSII